MILSSHKIVGLTLAERRNHYKRTGYINYYGLSLKVLIDEVARMESRSRSDFLREAARAYICRKQRWINIFAMGREIAEREELTAEDIEKEIKAYRKERNRNQ